MVNPPDLMVSDEIKQGLGTEILGREIFSYSQTSSTNDVALELAASGMEEGVLVVAESQTRGRGRRERRWLAPMGTSILASLILRPPIITQEAHVITLIAATAVAQTIRTMTGLPALIKWPNDVIIGNRKVSGILSEMRTENGQVSFVILGIGVTVNILPGRMPVEIADIATSLNAELGYNVPRIPLLQEILRQLERRYLDLKSRKMNILIAEWKALSAIIGSCVTINLQRRVVRGYALDIDETGALLVLMDEGQSQRITSDEAIQVRLVKPH